MKSPCRRCPAGRRGSCQSRSRKKNREKGDWARWAYRGPHLVVMLGRSSTPWKELPLCCNALLDPPHVHSTYHPFVFGGLIAFHVPCTQLAPGPSARHACSAPWRARQHEPPFSSEIYQRNTIALMAPITTSVASMNCLWPTRRPSLLSRRCLIPIALRK